MALEPAIQFGTQLLCERQVRGRQAVPQLLGELDALFWAQVGEVKDWGTHARNLG